MNRPRPIDLSGGDRASGTLGPTSGRALADEGSKDRIQLRERSRNPTVVAIVGIPRHRPQRSCSTGTVRAAGAAGSTIHEPDCGRNVVTEREFAGRVLPGVYSRKSKTTALLLSFFLGVFGVDRLYLGSLRIPVLCTFGRLCDADGAEMPDRDPRAGGRQGQRSASGVRCRGV